MFVTETCSCKTMFTANWWKLTPYTDLKNGTIAGIFPSILEKAIEMCCKDCSTQSLPEIDFVGMNRSLALKSGVLEVNANIGDDTDFHFPIYGIKSQTSYGDGFPYVPLVKSPGAAFIISSANQYNESDRVMKLMLNTWPFFLVLILTSYFVGLFIWLVVSFLLNTFYLIKCNNHHPQYIIIIVIIITITLTITTTITTATTITTITIITIIITL